MVENKWGFKNLLEDPYRLSQSSDQEQWPEQLSYLRYPNMHKSATLNMKNNKYA